MRRWYEPRKDRPDLERSAIRKRGFVGYMDMLWREFFELLKLNLLFFDPDVSERVFRTV